MTFDFDVGADASFQATLAEGRALTADDPVRVEVMSDITGHRFRARCTRCEMPVSWLRDRAHAEERAQDHLARVHGRPATSEEPSPVEQHPAEVLVASRTRPGVRYRVVIGIEGATVCNCAGFEFYGYCWHSRQVMEERMTSQALEVIKVQPPAALLPTQSELSIISTLAKTVVMARGHSVPMSIDSPAKAAAVMLAGWELGVKPLSALRHIAVVNGRTEPDGQLMAAIVMAKEPDARFDIVELSAERCVMRLRRPSRGVDMEYTATIEDAKRAGLVKNGNPWALYPQDMLRLSATKRLCRIGAPDLINALSAVSVADAGALMPEAASDEVTIDVDSLPAEALLNEGDAPEAAVVREVPSNVDPETGEVLDEEPAPTEEPSPVGDEAGERVDDGAADPVSEGEPAGESATPSPLGRWANIGAFVNSCYEDFGLNTGGILEALGWQRTDGIRKVLEFEGGLEGAYIHIAQQRLGVGQ